MRNLLSALISLFFLAAPAVAQIAQINELIANLVGLEVKGEDRSERQLIATQQSLSGISTLSDPSIGVFVPDDVLTAIVEQEIASQISDMDAGSGVSFDVEQTIVETGIQEIIANITGEVQFDDLGVKLEFTINAGFAPSIVNEQVELLPFVNAVIVDDVSVESSPLPLPTAAIQTAVNAFLQQVLQSANALLPVVRVTIPAPEPVSIDLTSMIEDTPGLTVQPPEITGIDVAFGVGAVFVNEAGLSAMVQIAFLGDSQPTAPPPVDGGEMVDLHNQLQEQFYGLASEKLGFDAEVSHASAYISKAVLATYVNETWKGFRPNVTYALDGLKERSAPTTIGLADRPTYSCRSSRNCSVSCSRDTRDCRACLLRRPWDGGCALRGNDPTCEAAKAAQNAIYATDCEARRLDCERLKATENIGCEIGKGFVSALAEIGDIGRIQADIEAIGTVSLQSMELALAPDLDVGSISQNLSARSNVRVGLDFVPFDIGHVLACPFPGKVFYEASVQIPNQASTLSMEVASEIIEDDVLNIKVTGAPSPIEANISPAPLRGILEQNPQLAFTCSPVLSGTGIGLSILGEARGVVSEADIRNLFGGEALAIMRGTYRHEFEPLELDIPIEAETFKIGEVEFAGRLQLTEKSVVATFSQ